jgi:hypothetical protein
MAVVRKPAALRTIGGNSWPDDSAVGKRPYRNFTGHALRLLVSDRDALSSGSKIQPLPQR